MTAVSTTSDPDASEPDLELDVVPTYSLLARVGAEALGAFIVVFIGVGTSLWWSVLSGATGAVLAVSLAFGVAILGATAAVGQISGGHFNPAVTLGAAVSRRLPWADLVPYWVAQLIGALLAGSLLFLLMPQNFAAVTGQTNRTWFSNTANGFAEHSPLARSTEGALTFGVAHVLLIEAVATAILVAVALVTTDRAANPRTAAIAIAPATAIGLTFFALHLLVNPFSGSALNPARATASALYSDAWAIGQLWLFWVAPLLGAALAGLVYQLVSPRGALPSVEFPDEELALESGDDDQATAVLAHGAAAVAEYERDDSGDDIDEVLARRAANAGPEPAPPADPDKP